MKLDGFLVSILIVVVLAYFFPGLAAEESSFPIDAISTAGITLIFFFYGLKLSPEKIRSGLSNWKLHLLVQSSTFVLFPLIILLFKPLVQTEYGETIWLAFLFLAALPSTVSSSVVMVSIARGNLPAAIFNASISGLVGIAITPLWMGFFLQETTGEFDLSSVYLKLISEILIPILIGLALQRYWGKFTTRYMKQLTLFDKSVILLIIYKSFAESFEDNLFSAVRPIDLLYITLVSVLLFYAVYFLIGFLSDWLRFNREDRITAQYCGTKKSLVHGTVFSKILFQNSAPLGIILLPLMIFHALQIFIISVMASKLSKEAGS